MEKDFNVKTNYVLYDDFNFIYKKNLTTNITTKLNGIVGSTVDMASDNQNLYTCYPTKILKTNYLNNILQYNREIIITPKKSQFENHNFSKLFG